MIPSMKAWKIWKYEFCKFSESHFAPIPTFGGEIGQVYLGIHFYLMHSHVFEQTSKLAISKNHAWSQLLEFWGSEVLATIAAKQVHTPTCFIHYCMLNSSVE